MVGRDADKIMLRVPRGMRETIKAKAAKNERSMNAELVHELRKLYPEHQPETN